MCAWLWVCLCVCLQHFVCAKCEKPFLGHRHYERKGLAYCETHYNQVTLDRIGNVYVKHELKLKLMTVHLTWASEICDK